jgi:hypothetical protein
MRLFLVLALAITAGSAHGFEPVTSADDFARTVAGRQLTRTGIRLEVLPSGRITGTGFGRDVTGQWRWEGGFFCRDMDWGGRSIGFNCQRVLRDGDRVRFIADQGSGDFADFRIR